MSDPVKIPPERLSPEALASIIDDLVLGEATEYGLHDVPIETKRERVRRALDTGDAVIYFDPETETCSIRLAESER
jgi:uncharacterized protein YheU (UPF0270 family)